MMSISKPINNRNAVNRNSGLVAYSDYSACNSTKGTFADAWNEMTAGDNIVQFVNVSDIWVDAANGDFRLKPNAVCLNAGRPPLVNGVVSIGAWQRKSFLGMD